MEIRSCTFATLNRRVFGDYLSNSSARYPASSAFNVAWETSSGESTVLVIEPRHRVFFFGSNALRSKASLPMK